MLMEILQLTGFIITNKYKDMLFGENSVLNQRKMFSFAD